MRSFYLFTVLFLCRCSVQDDCNPIPDGSQEKLTELLKRAAVGHLRNHFKVNISLEGIPNVENCNNFQTLFLTAQFKKEYLWLEITLWCKVKYIRLPKKKHQYVVLSDNCTSNVDKLEARSGNA